MRSRTRWGPEGLRVVVVRAGDRAARRVRVAAAQGVVEDHDTRRPRRRCDEIGGFAVIDGRDLVLVPEIHRGFVPDDLEALHIEARRGLKGPGVVDRDGMGVGRDVGLVDAGGGLEQVSERLPGHRPEEIQFGVHVRQRGRGLHRIGTPPEPERERQTTGSWDALEGSAARKPFNAATTPNWRRSVRRPHANAPRAADRDRPPDSSSWAPERRSAGQGRAGTRRPASSPRTRSG